MVCLRGMSDYPKTNPHNLAKLRTALDRVLLDIGVNNFATYTKAGMVRRDASRSPTAIHSHTRRLSCPDGD